MSRPKTAIQSSRKHPTSERISYIDCPLSSPDLPIVSDIEHKAGHCFCHHCACGLHTCPGGLNKFSRSTSLSWSSKYKQDYKVKHGHRETPIMPKEYKSFLKTSTSSNHLSTNHSEFTQQDFIKSESFKPNSMKANVKFSGRSSYERDFTEWKCEQNRLMSPNYPYRGYMVKNWNSESTYKNTFRKHPTQQNKIMIQGSNVKSIVNPGESGEFNTTSGTFYKKEKNLGPSSPDIAILRNKKEIYKLSSSKGHYVTAYSADFVAKPIGSTLSRLR